MSEEKGKVLTRIFIQPDGTIVVTDLWEEIGEILKEEDGFTHVVDPSL